MSHQEPLLHPLRSEQLAPRPYAQAVWNAASAVPPEPCAPVSSAPASGLMHAAAFAGQTCGSAEQTEDAEMSLDALISAVSPETDDEEDGSDEPDALPTEQMPVPVSVPLFEEPSAGRRFRFWPALVLVFAAGMLYAAWHFGWLKMIFP